MSEGVDAGLSVSVRNLGGIDAHEEAFEPGVTLLTGRNATNRTSLLQSVASGLGGSAGELKSDADEGSAELVLDGETAMRRLERAGEGIRTSGDPYTDETALVDVACCLLESNPARRAVQRGDGERLREVVMRPVDTAAIAAEIEATREDLRDVEAEIESVERRAESLPDLEQRRQQLLTEREQLRDDIEAVRERVEEHEADAEAAEEAEAVLDRLRSTREEFETVRDRLATQRSALESLADERADLAAELDDLDVPEDELAEVDEEVDRLQGRKRRLENTIQDLVSILEFNDDLLAGGTDDLPFGADADPTAGLDPASRTIECWTCGTAVERATIVDRVDDLRDTLADLREERRTLDDRVDDLRDTQSELRDAVDRRDELADELAAVDEEIDERTARIDDLEDREASLRDEIEELEAAAEASEEVRDSDLLDQYQELSELEYERGQVEERLASVESEVEEIEARREALDDLRARRSDRRDHLESLRTRIEDLERSVADTFNDQMETVVERLDYGNVERVWIERKADGDDDEGVPAGSFDLHVVRTGDDGAVYEDSVDHLSESEREVIGLVVALTGYLVHEAHETVPVVLLDSLEAIDAERIASLVDHVADHVPYLLVALLPEDAEALPDRYRRVEMCAALA